MHKNTLNLHRGSTCTKNDKHKVKKGNMDINTDHDTYIIDTKELIIENMRIGPQTKDYQPTKKLK